MLGALGVKAIKFYGHKNMIYPLLGQLRENKNYSQELLASKMQLLGVGIDQQAISKIENNKRSVTDFELLCICKILNVEEKCLTKDFWNRMR